MAKPTKVDPDEFPMDNGWSWLRFEEPEPPAGGHAEAQSLMEAVWEMVLRSLRTPEESDG